MLIQDNIPNARLKLLDRRHAKILLQHKDIISTKRQKTNNPTSIPGILLSKPDNNKHVHKI